ncbi:MAG: BatA domain-containing protein [Verrucomicrobiales bacterium]|jgi:hypothetical protein|nr:BatA domain-containing protein [Verrucomicrobiales bacterium]
MTFLAPLMLLALTAVGLPVLIHLFSKPRLKRIRWAATKFLLASIEKNKRRMKVEDLLLLLARCLLVALLVLIFARPALLVKSAGLLLSRDNISAALVLDYSMSMGQSDGAKTRFEQAKATALDILGKLGGGSSCALWLAGDKTRSVIAKPTQDFALLRRMLDHATVSDFGSDLYPALKGAVESLKGTEGRKEIFILTDNQAAAWKQLGNIRKLQDEHQREIQFRYFVIGDRGEDNVAVTALQVVGTAAVNQPVRCVVTVSNHGRSAVEKLPVKISVDDEPPQDETVIDRLEPGASRNVSLFARVRHAGYHAISASIAGDRLPADNQRATALLVLEQLRALVVDGTVSANPAERDGFFLRNALAPVAPGQAGQYYLKVAAGKPGDLDGQDLRQYDLVFLANVPELSPSAMQNISRYVNEGGNLVVFAGSASKADFYNDEENLGALLPAKLGAVQKPEPPLAWQSRDYAHPVVTLWNDPESGTLGSVKFYQYYPLTLRDGALTVLKYSNNEIAVAERAAGRGKVFLFGSPAMTDWNNFPVNPAFVPLTLRIVAYAAGRSARGLNLSPGQTFAFEVETEYAGKDVAVARGGAEKRRIVGRVEQGGRAAWIRYQNTELAGAYAVYVGDDQLPKVVFAVQGDAVESDLRQEPAEDIAALLHPPEPESRDVSVSDPEEQAPGVELWFYVAVAALALAVTESGLKHYFSRAR